MADSYSGLSSPTLSLQGITLLGVPEITFATTGDKLFIDVPFKCYVYRACVLLNAAPGDAGIVKFDKRPTYASDTGRGDGDVEVVNLKTSMVAGDVAFSDASANVALEPGEQVVVEVTDASAAVTLARAWLLVREVPETPANMTNMKDGSAA